MLVCTRGLGTDGVKGLQETKWAWAGEEWVYGELELVLPVPAGSRARAGKHLPRLLAPGSRRKGPGNEGLGVGRRVVWEGDIETALAVSNKQTNDCGR